MDDLRYLLVENESAIEAHRSRVDVRANDLDNKEWKHARATRITRYWSGDVAPESRHAEARLLWSDAALTVRFQCNQHEPLVVSDAPQTNKKTVGLWDRDVCEIFVAPKASEPEKYLEFEAAPTGEWIDLSIHWRPEGQETDWEFHSGMEASARVSHNHVIIAMRVPWEAFGHKPQAGERWRANLFRCVGRDPARGYLAWRPTRTPQPSFHVPQAFGWLEFKG
ncbi:MAG TPA: carbohydrate-binding family 9-like protein [Pyrinomonadaceae bacterium]|nr:carbohydrate-binding family 9-like protein [Pyrinomonadaceae bacterium]